MSGDAALACALFAIDPVGLGGILVRGPADAARDAVLAGLREALEDELLTVPPYVTVAQMTGEPDWIAAMAGAGGERPRSVLERADGRIVLLPMAERRDVAALSPLLAALDTGQTLGPDGLASSRFGVVALDEGRDEEAAPIGLRDRLAFMLTPGAYEEPPDIGDAPLMLPHTVVSDETVSAICAASVVYGVESLRACVFAVRAARAHAALHGRERTEPEDTAAAARLVIGPRATRMPAPPEDAPEEAPDETTDQAPEPPPDQPPEPQDREAEAQDKSEEENLAQAAEDLVVAAVRASVPENVLAQVAGQQAARAARGAGGFTRSARRGRPAGVRRRTPRDGERLALPETLRAAAPWQRLRGAEPGRIAVRPGDLHVRTLRQRVTATTIFVVDASGSAARERLAEAKGAVEALLASCYVRRDQVALIAFRVASAELLVPPTRSLTRAKRLLGALPGGGGTPLAAGLRAARDLADGIRKRGGSPSLVVLTDGRANVGLDGRGGRERAMAEARDAARAIAGSRLAAVVIDTGARPQAAAASVAQAMGARYVALPGGDGRALARAVGA